MKLFYKKASTLNLTLWASAKKKPAPGAHAPVRAIATGAAGEAGSLPSQSPSGASVSAAASGAVCQWQTSSTDRRGSGDRPLGNVPPGRSGPKGRAKSRLPLWGALVPSGHRSALDRAGRRECPLRGRRGLLQQPTPRTCASLLMSTSEASCHRREWRAQALGRESPGVQPPGSFCLVKGKSEVFFRDFSLFAGESGCFLQNPRAVL